MMTIDRLPMTTTITLAAPQPPLAVHLTHQYNLVINSQMADVMTIGRQEGPTAVAVLSGKVVCLQASVCGRDRMSLMMITLVKEQGIRWLLMLTMESDTVVRAHGRTEGRDPNDFAPTLPIVTSLRNVQILSSTIGRRA